jgi:nitric oxide reductase subunit B
MKSYQTTFSIKRLWIILSVGMVVMFGSYCCSGSRSTRAPPIPEAVKSQSGETLFRARHRDRPEYLAVDRRHGAGLDLGPWQLSGARLERRLAAPEAEALLALSAAPLPAAVPAQAEAMRKAALQGRNAQEQL